MTLKQRLVRIGASRIAGVMLFIALIVLLLKSSQAPAIVENRPAPDFHATTLTGLPISLQSLRGKFVLLDFWATWCPPCRMSIPGTEKLYQKFHKDGFDVVGISLDEGGSALVRDFVKQNGMTYPIIMGVKTTIPSDYGVSPIPSFFLIDKNGRIRWHQEGYSLSTDHDLTQYIRQLLSQ